MTARRLIYRFDLPNFFHFFTFSLSNPSLTDILNLHFKRLMFYC